MNKLSTNRILGLDISDYSLEVLGLEKDFWGKPRVTAYNRVVLESGVVSGGKILQPEILIARLQDLLAGAWPKPITDRLCLLSFPESQVFTHLFRLPASATKLQLKKVILNEVQKLNAISLNQVYFDWQIIKRDPEELAVFFIACDKDLIYQYIQASRQAGLILLAIDLEAASLGRALLAKNDRVVLIIDIGARTTNAGYFENDHILGSITLPIGGNNFTAAIISRGYSLRRAEALKKEIGVDGSGKIITTILEQEFPPLVKSLNDFIHYFRGQGYPPPERIILAGGSSLMPHLREFLGAGFNQPVEIRDPLTKIALKDYQPDSKFVLYANVVGLALRGLSRNPHRAGINLLSLGDYSF